MSLFNILLNSSPRGRSLKRPREIEPVLSSFGPDFSVQSTDSPRKQRRKTAQLSQFSIYQDAISTANSDGLSGSNDPTPATIRSEMAGIWPNTLNSPRKQRRKTLQLPQFATNQDEILTQNSDELSSSNGSTPVTIGPERGKIWPHISVEIPFRSEFRPISAISGPKKGPRQPLASLLSISLNSTRKAPKIPQKWIENQPNDHTSTFFKLISAYFVHFYTFFN